MAALERAVEFIAQDHLEIAYALRSLVGKRGLLLGFVGDIWMQSSVHLLRWMTREAEALRRLDVETAALVGNAPHTLHGFITASPLPPRFPLLADADGVLHAQYNMAQPGAVLIDAELRIRARWLMQPEGMLRPKQLMRTVEALGLG